MGYKKIVEKRDLLTEELSQYISCGVEEVQINILKSGSEFIYVARILPESYCTELLMAQNYMTHTFRRYIANNKDYMTECMKWNLEVNKVSPQLLLKMLKDGFSLQLSRKRKDLVSSFRKYVQSPYRHQWFFPKSISDIITIQTDLEKGAYVALILLRSEEDINRLDRDWVSEYVNHQIGAVQGENFKMCSAILAISREDLADRGLFEKVEQTGSILFILKRDERVLQSKYFVSIPLQPMHMEKTI